MGNYDSGRASDFGGINIELRRADSLNGIRFDVNRADPTSANDVILYRGASSSLRFWDGTSATTLGSAGALANFSLNDAYDDGPVMTVDGDAVRLNASHATNNALELRLTGAGTGNMIDIQNDSTGTDGFDIQGTDNLWSVSTAGALLVASIADVTTGATLQVDGNGTGGVTIGGVSSGIVTITPASTLTGAVTATASITITGTAATNVFTVTAGDLVVSDGSLTMTDADNANTLAITNNTVSSSALVALTANGVTTGDMILLTTTDAGLTSGTYIRCNDGADVFTVADEGAVTIVGGGGINVLSITAGDVVLSDGSITVTDADNAASLSVTNNTATTASPIEFIGSGAFTGTGSTAFISIEPTGLTSGDAVNIQVDLGVTGSALRLASTGAVTGVGAALEVVYDAATTAGALVGEGVVQISADGLTTGVALNVESISNEVLTSGGLADFEHTAVGTTVAAITGAIFDVSSSVTESGTSTQNYDVVAITRTSIHDTAGTLTAQGSVLRLENVATQTAATLTDTVAGLEIVMDADGTGDAINITHNATAGRLLDMTSSATSLDGVIQVVANSVAGGNVMVMDMNGLTTGIGLELTHTTSVITTGSVCRITSTGIDTGTGQGTLLDLVSSGATAAVVVSLVSDAIVGGTGFFGSFDGLTTGFGMNLTHTTSVIASGGSILQLSSTGVDTATTTGCVANFIGSGSTAGTQFLQTYAALTTGVGMRMVANAVTSGIMLDLETSAAGFTGNYIRCYDGAAVDFSVGLDGRHIIAGAAGIAAIAVTAGDITTADGAIASAQEAVTLAAGVATFACDSNLVSLTGDAAANSITTITGGVAGQILVILCVDALVTFVDDNTHAANTIDLVGANLVSADDLTLTLIFDGTSWYQITQSAND